MKITEMNNCIEEMRKCYNFKDDETEIGFVHEIGYDDRCVFISTIDENGTKIDMTRRAAGLVNV